MSSNAVVSSGFPMSASQLLVSGIMGPSPTAHVAKGVLPDYIRPLPAKFLEVDIDFLQAKGALDIPEVELRNELLKSYIQYVHPFMPLLDLDEFLGIILRGDASSQLSLLLFQAVMFAGTAFVNIRHLHAAGYDTRKEARKAFFRRARVCVKVSSSACTRD
jgi:hypothetical protein